MSFHENEPILDGRGNRLMPATPIFQKHCFFKKCPKNLTNFGKFKIFFLHFLLQFYRAFQWYIVCFHTLSTLGCTDQNVNQEIGGYAPFFQRLYFMVNNYCKTSLRFPTLKVSIYNLPLFFHKESFKMENDSRLMIAFPQQPKMWLDSFFLLTSHAQNIFKICRIEYLSPVHTAY